MIRQGIERSGEIPKHRIGTDLFLKVYVTRICGEPEDFSNASDLKVTLWHMFHPWRKEENFTVGGGEISLQLSADEQRKTGIYGVTVSYSKADEQSETGVRKFAVDIPYAFELVAISQTCDCVGRVDLCGHVQIAADGINGLTPYIGENGNWWVGGEDTGKPSQGKDGEPGTFAYPVFTVDPKTGVLTVREPFFMGDEDIKLDNGYLKFNVL